MSLVREAELPGLGKKFEVALENGDKVVVVIHDDGTREVYHFPENEDEPSGQFVFSDQEARRIGSIISGAYYEPKALEKLETDIADLRIEWLRVKENSPINGKNIGDLALRKNFGINVISVIDDKCRNRTEACRINPGPGFLFNPGQMIIVAGNTEKMKQFKKDMFQPGG